MYNHLIKISISLLVFLIPLFWLPFSFEVFEFNKQYLLFFLTSLALMFWLAKMVFADKEIKFKRTPLDIPVLAFFAIAVLSSVFSVDKFSSLFGFYGRFSDGIIGLASFVVLYFLITNNAGIENKSQKQKTKNEEQNQKAEKSEPVINIDGLLKVFTLSIFFAILISYLSLFGVWGRIIALLGGKISLPAVMQQSIFNPVAGSMEGLSVLLAVFIVFLAGKMILGMSQKGKVISYLLSVFSLLFLIIVDFNIAWIILAVSLILFLALVLWKRIFRDDVNKLLLPVILIIVSFVFIAVDSSGIQSAVLKHQLPQEQVLNQGNSWEIGLGSATDNVKSGFLGSGLGTFHYDFSKFKPASFNQDILWQIRFDRPGSHFAEILGTMGFLGILSWLFLLGFFFVISYFFLQKGFKGLPFFMVFLALAVAQIFFYQNTVLGFVFWLFLALSVASWQKPLQEKKISFKDFPELSLIFSAVFIILALVFAGLYLFGERFYLADVKYANFSLNRLDLLEKAAELNPYQAQYKLILARSYLNKISEEFQRPEAERDEASIPIYVVKAITYTKSGEIGMKPVVGATELAPGRVAAWETMAMVYRDIQGIADGALGWGIKSFEKAIELEPLNPVLHTELGKMYIYSNDIDKAMEKFNRAKELKPDYLDTSIQISRIHESNNNLDAAIAELESMAVAYPFNTEVLFQLGRLYFNNNKLDYAISQFERIIALMPNHSNAIYSLGVAYQKKGQKQKAIDFFEKVLELNPGNKDVEERISELK